VESLDKGRDIEVYAKLPKSFTIPTPVGGYPDWAIAFKQGLQICEIEKSKIACARKFFAKITSDQVRYDVVDNYAKLMELVH